MTVPGADLPVQTVTGPMPGNQFILGVTHCFHEITITGDSLDIIASASDRFSYCNGFQIVAVPEPGSILGLFAGLAIVARSRTQSSTPTPA